MAFKLGLSTLSADERTDELRFLETAAGRELLAELDLALLSPDDEAPGVLLEFEEELPSDKEQAANFRALTEVLGHVTFIVEAYEDNGKLWGYWRGPEENAIRDAPIVSYDSEGTIQAESGESLLEALVCHASYENEPKFQALKSKLASHGIVLGATTWKNWGRSRKSKTDPEKLHDELYAKYKG